MFFKKKKNCFHSWTMIDFENYVDSSLAIEEHYVLGCTNCNEKRIVDEYEYEKMLKVNLIK